MKPGLVRPQFDVGGLGVHWSATGCWEGPSLRVVDVSQFTKQGGSINRLFSEGS